MARNVEIKARVDDISLLHERVRALTGQSGKILYQEDIFFHVPSGRLKLRIFADEQGELIHYHRADATGPKISDYHLVPIPDPRALQRLLRNALGERAIVRKKRTLYLLGRTRIHVDEVENLGTFMELEVVLLENEDAEAGTAEARQIMERFGILENSLIQGAYVDLLLERGASRSIPSEATT